MVPTLLPLLTLLASVSASPLSDCIKATSINAAFPDGDDASLKEHTKAYNTRVQPIAAGWTLPSSSEDVSAIVTCAAQSDVKVAARSGGHSYASQGLGESDGALVVDLSQFKSIEQVPGSDGVWKIGGGNRLGDIALALNAAGRALPHGTCPWVGIGGHAGLGGFGNAGRMWGLTLDTVQAYDVVLANGTMINDLTYDQNPDLFFALNGAGPSFGVITSYHFQTLPIPTEPVLYFNYHYGKLSVQDNIQVFRAFQNIGAQLPKDVAFTYEIRAGGGPSISGRFYADASSFNATLSQIEAAIPSNFSQTLQTFDWIGSVKHTSGGQDLNTTLPGSADYFDNFYAKSILSPDGLPVSDSALQGFFGYIDATATASKWFVEVNYLGGSTISDENRLSRSSFAWREANMLWQLYGSHADVNEAFPSSEIAYIQGMYDQIVQPMAATWGSRMGSYPNYADPFLTTSEVQSLYWGQQYGRLSAIKAKYDPRGMLGGPLGVAVGQAAASPPPAPDTPQVAAARRHARAFAPF